MDLFLNRLFDGFEQGITYGGIALALVLIFKATTLINFAQGELAMLGAFVVYVLTVEQGMGVWIAIPAAMLITAVLAAGVERTLIRPFDPSDHLPLVIITLGLFLVINSAAGIIWQFNPRRFPTIFPEGNALEIGGASLTWNTLFMVGSVLGVLGIIELLLKRTKIGLAFRAVSSNLESSQLVGIRVGRTLQLGWAISAAVGTFAATVFVARPILFLEPTAMLRVLIFATAAAALGGLDSLRGAVIGGLIIGLLQSLVIGYVSFLPSELSLAIALVVILGVLLVRPAGLFGSTRVERV